MMAQTCCTICLFSDRNEVIRQIHDEEKASNLMELLEYDEDVAGGLMAKELIKANHNWNILQCIEEIRKQAENIEKIYSVYVVNDKEELIGKVGLKKLILANDRSRVEDIYDEELCLRGNLYGGRGSSQHHAEV